MSDRLDEFGADTTVVLVTFTAPAELEAYLADHDLDFDVLVDPDRVTYRAYGLGRGTVARVWGWRAGRRYWEILCSQGLAGLSRPTEDTLQLGGDFVIAADGTLAWGHWGDGPDDRPRIDALAAAVRSASPDPS